MKKILFNVILIAVLSSVCIKANEKTWEDIYGEAIKNNPDLANAKNSLKTSELNYNSSLLNFTPDISGSAGVRKSDSSDVSYNYGLSGRLSLFAGFKNYSEVKIKSAEYSIQEAYYKKS